MWTWLGSREQFLHCGLRKFRHSKSSVYRWYTQLDRRLFVYENWDNGSRLGRVMVECTLSITHCLRLNLQLHTISLVRTCRISSFCTVAWQLARFQLTRRIARSLRRFCSGSALLTVSSFAFHFFHCDFCRNTTVRYVIRMARTNVVCARVIVIFMVRDVSAQKSLIYRIAEST